MVQLESTDTVRASDIGYRDLSDGIFPPLLNRAFEIDRSFALPPGSDVVGATWGTMTLLNPNGAWDGVAASKSSDGRPVTIYTGSKVYDQPRGIWKDPAFTGLKTVFSGIAKGWFLSETELQVPLTDATYFIEDRPLQSVFYLGTGGYEGPSSLTGQPKPKTRGGTTAYPVSNVTPVQIDAPNLIYQYNDGPGTVVGIYEGGAVTYTSGGDTTDLYANPPAPGEYKTDNSRGMIRLGTKPIRPVTLDVTGSFPVAGVKTGAADIALNLLTEDAALDVDYIDTASFTALNTAYPWTCGYYFSGEIGVTNAVSLFLRSIGAKMVPTRTGTLKAMALRAVASSAVPAANLTTGELVDLTPLQLKDPLDPPADLWRIGWNKNHTIQTSDLSQQTTDTRKVQIAQDWQISAFFSADINAAYRRPSRPPIVETANLVTADASSLASAVGALWGVRRRLYAAEVPVDIGLNRDIGDIVRIIYPLDDLASGKLGIIVGEQYRSTDATMTLQILV